MFGELQLVVKKNYRRDPELQNLIAEAILIQQNISIRCATATGELMKISGYEFQRKVLNHFRIGRMLAINAKKKIQTYWEQSQKMIFDRKEYNQLS